jgi:hypothetical protein
VLTVCFMDKGFHALSNLVTQHYLRQIAVGNGWVLQASVGGIS